MMLHPEHGDQDEAEDEADDLTAVLDQECPVLVSSIAASDTDSSNGRISSVIAIATTASTKAFRRSGANVVCSVTGSD
ncbi:hypothetical protein QFZ46_002266 [Microbacterium murale]|uniref:Uncharacterized protein n=1 Tax=Microbacterium murale TaxID=1081040 RepID=A0ABU0P9T7_9MICO|nr:hypothetical protein [Microbacterium murale]